MTRTGASCYKGIVEDLGRRRILFTIRDRNDFVRKNCFSVVKRVRFEMKSDALKSTISES